MARYLLTHSSNKIVFVGATASGLGDYIATPFSSQTPGVEKHATVTENILHEKFVIRGRGERSFMTYLRLSA